MRKQRREIHSYHGRRNRGEGLWLPAAGVLLAVSLCARLVPGIRFTVILCGALAGVCLGGWLLRRWSEYSAAGRAAYRALTALLCAGLVAFGCVEGLLLIRGSQDNSALPAAAVIVLGAGINGETPSLMLQSRIDAAAEYLLRHPEVPAVLTGGQGDGESISEAEAMRRGLTALGVAEDRLHLEDRATSTAENFAFSRQILEELGLAEGRIAVVTNSFHCYRSHLLAQREGLTVMDVPAETPWLILEINYYMREAFALVKTLIFD